MSKIDIVKARFKDKIQIDNDLGCWIWIGAKLSNYGGFSYNGKLSLAHRVSYELFIGEIEKDLCVCHKCDNSLCVNPNHLFLGTRYDNAEDKRKKNRSNIKKLSNDDFKYMFELFDGKKEYKFREVSDKLNISLNYLYLIKNIYDRVMEIKNIK